MVYFQLNRNHSNVYFNMLTSKMRNTNCDQQAKFIQERIILAEKFFSEICKVFAEYTRKAARMRDKNDEIAKVFMNYAEVEDVNKSLTNGLGSFALSLSILGDIGDIRVQKIETKILSEVVQYEGICKNAKEDVKHIFSVRDKELARRRQLDRIRVRNPRNRMQITQAETELLKATAEVSRTIHDLEEQTNDFEKRKIHDLKQSMLTFITIEMQYHAKALEVLTKAYQEVNDVDEDSDLQDFQNVRGSLDLDFRKSLRSADAVPHYNIKRNNFRSSHSFGSLSTLFSTPVKNRSMEAKRNDSRFLSKSNDTLESIQPEYLPSADSIPDNESDISTVSDIGDQFLARKYKSKSK